MLETKWWIALDLKVTNVYCESMSDIMQDKLNGGIYSFTIN